MLDVGALLEDAENRGGVLEHVDELQDHNSQVSCKIKKKRNDSEVLCKLTLKQCLCRVLQLNARLQEIENQATEKISELETQLMQSTKETELLKVSAGFAHDMVKV